MIREKLLLSHLNRRFIHITVSDAAWAVRLLESEYQAKDFNVKDDHNILLFDTSLSVAGINQTLVQNGLGVSELHLCEDTLEDYFKRVTGGEGIA